MKESKTESTLPVIGVRAQQLKRTFAPSALRPSAVNVSAPTLKGNCESGNAESKIRKNYRLKKRITKSSFQAAMKFYEPLSKREK